MKKIVFCLLIFIWAFKTYSQEKDYFSAELDANYYYYFFLNNNFNYGSSILISKYIHKLKMSSGINYSVKSFYTQGDPFYSIKKRDYKIAYLNFPIIGNIEIISQKSFYSSILIGFAFNRIINYGIKSYYLNDETLIENNIKKDQILGVSIICGITISKPINNRFILNLSPCVNYKLIPDHRDQRPNYRSLPDDKISVGLKIGAEYLLKTPGNE
ncbi:MAG: hypothetical protein Fur0028_13620 [Bacteroidales bacterium]